MSLVVSRYVHFRKAFGQSARRIRAIHKADFCERLCMPVYIGRNLPGEAGHRLSRLGFFIGKLGLLVTT